VHIISVLSSVHKFMSIAGSNFDRGSSLDPTSKFRQRSGQRSEEGNIYIYIYIYIYHHQTKRSRYIK